MTKVFFGGSGVTSKQAPVFKIRNVEPAKEGNRSQKSLLYGSGNGTLPILRFADCSSSYQIIEPKKITSDTSETFHWGWTSVIILRNLTYLEYYYLVSESINIEQLWARKNNTYVPLDRLDFTIAHVGNKHHTRYFLSARECMRHFCEMSLFGHCDTSGKNHFRNLPDFHMRTLITYAPIISGELTRLLRVVVVSHYD